MNNDKNKQQQSEETPIYLTSDSTLQTPSEHRHDQQVDPRKDNTIAVSNDDVRESDADRMRNDLDGGREGNDL